MSPRASSSTATLPALFWRLPLRTPGLPGSVNSYLVGHREAILVDPGSDFPAELDRLRRRIWELLGSGGELRMLLLTHHHRDHSAGALLLSAELGVPLAAHPATLERLPRKAGAWLLPLEPGARLSLAPALELEALHTPGHAAGHLCLLERRLGVLLGGDMVPGEGSTLIDPAEGEMRTYLASLERLLELRAELLLPGHGRPCARASERIAALIEHRLWREQRVLDALEPRPQSCGEIARRAYLGTELPLLRWPLAYRSTLAHLLKLEAEGRAAREGPDAWLSARSSAAGIESRALRCEPFGRG